MEVSLELARYIIGLLEYKIMEIGIDDEDLKVREEIETAHPILRTERLTQERKTHIHKVEVEKDPRVVAIRKEIAESNRVDFALADKLLQMKRVVYMEIAAKEGLL